MTTEKKSDKKAEEEDWGIEKPKTGIAIETKVGLCLIFILLSAFGLVVYQKINRPQENMAINNPEEKPGEEDQAQSDDPFGKEDSSSSTSPEVENQSDQFNAVADNSGFSTPQEESKPESLFERQQSEPQRGDPFSDNTFGNQSDSQQTTEIAANQTENGFQQFDPATDSDNEFKNPSQNEFQSDPATFDNPQKDAFSSADQFAQQPGASPTGAAQENNFNSEPPSEFLPEGSAENSGLMKQPAENEFAQAAEGVNGTIQVEEDPFGGNTTTEVGQNLPAQPEGNEFGNFDPPGEANFAQKQNAQELPPKSAQVKITDISSSNEFGSFEDEKFPQSEPQPVNTPTENAFQQDEPTAATQEIEQPQVAEFNDGKMNQNEERFGNFRAEEFSAEQAESVTTVKRPAAAIDSGTFRDSEMPAQQEVPQAQGLFDEPAPVTEVSTQKFGSFQEKSFNQQPAQNIRGEYTVQNGENFWTISKKLYGSGRYFQLLAEINRSRVNDPRKMKPGLKLLTPDRSSIDAQYQARHKAAQTTVSEFSGKKTIRKKSKPQGFFISQDGQPMYRVGSSDTLTDISQKHLGRSSRWYQIYQINRQRLQNPNKLQIGTELQLPYDASRLSLVPGNSTSR